MTIAYLLHGIRTDMEDASQLSQNAGEPPTGTIRVLLVSEAFPSAEDAMVEKLLDTLLTLGHEVTFIAREGLDGHVGPPVLQSLGIRTYAGDHERLKVLGKLTSEPQSWAIEPLLREKRFDLAIFTEALESGVSVPEQYLGLIRTQSPGTRIMIITSCLYEPGQRPSARDRRAVEEFERKEDYFHRQAESFERADLVLIVDQDHLISLLAGCEIRGLGPCSNESISAAIQQAVKTQPTPVAASPPASVLQVETLFAARLSGRTGLQRILGQLECYVLLAGLLMSENKYVEARAQLRHVFGRIDGSFEADDFVTHVTTLLRRCYRILGDSDFAEMYAEAARSMAIDRRAEVSRQPGRKGTDAPLVSLIVPTYNRLPILRKCLAAIEKQTLSPDKFEVLVIDDGSTDGTGDFLHHYRAPFSFVHLRQSNSGTGAARRHGASEAKGDYLLLMNDDTICDPQVLEEHLRVHNRLQSQCWAVLGSFEYPSEAQRRALTYYFCVEPFMFPQVSMEDGCPYGYSQFITCNLSIRRDAVMDAGSFSSIYKLSEDTELGLRLFEKGYRVLYHPAAHAWHDHLPYPARNLIRRARVYGTDYFHMFRQHPRVMKEWAMPVPLTAMDEQNAARILAYVESNRKDVEQAMEALEKWDDIDFASVLERNRDTAKMVLTLFRQAVPAIHWFYLYETMFQTMVVELNLAHMTPRAPGSFAAGAAVASR